MSEELDVGMKCIKYMLFVANFMFMMIGFLLVSIGSAIKTIYLDFDLFMATHYFSPANLSIAIGIIIIVVAIFGCVGAFKESTCLVNSYGFLLVLILILEISVVITAYTMRSNIFNIVFEKMDAAMDNYNTDEYAQYSWDFMQERLRCCGIYYPGDWNTATESTNDVIPIEEMDGEQEVVELFSNDTWAGPASCCKYPESCNIIWGVGCLNKLVYLISETALLLGCGVLAVAFVQFLGVVFAHMLAKAIRRLKTQSLVESTQNRQKLYEQLARGKDKDEKPTPVLYTPSYTEA